MKKNLSLLGRFDAFWFAPVTAKGFGLMRVVLGAFLFVSFAIRLPQVGRLYSDDGVLPRADILQMARADYHFTILSYVGSEAAVYALFIAFLVALALMTLGIAARTMTIVSAILLFSFHERMLAVLTGGDTLLRNIMFILAFAPHHRSFSLWSYVRRRRAFRAGARDPGSSLARMAVWPVRLLLWQYACMYLMSVWTKLLGTMWLDGSAADVGLHHLHFARLPWSITDHLYSLGYVMTFFTLLTQLAWGLLLIVPVLGWIAPRFAPALSNVPWKRLVLGGTFLMHVLILLLLDVGDFSFISLIGYLGLLDDSDFAAMRRMFRRKTIIVLFDGHCGLCRSAAFTLVTLDWLRRLQLVDFRDASQRKIHAPNITVATLDRSMHIRLDDGTYKKGFAAFRHIATLLPVLWVFVPFLYVPGASLIGEAVYARIAERRKTCTHETCR